MKASILYQNVSKAFAIKLLQLCDFIDFIFFSFFTFFQYVQKELQRYECKQYLKESFIKIIILFFAVECFTFAMESFHYKALLTVTFGACVAYQCWKAFYDTNSFYRNLNQEHYVNGFFPLTNEVYVTFHSELGKKLSLMIFTFIMFIIVTLPILLCDSDNSHIVTLTLAAILSSFIYSWFSYSLNKFKDNLFYYELA